MRSRGRRPVDVEGRRREAEVDEMEGWVDW